MFLVCPSEDSQDHSLLVMVASAFHMDMFCKQAKIIQILQVLHGIVGEFYFVWIEDLFSQTLRDLTA